MAVSDKKRHIITAKRESKSDVCLYERYCLYNLGYFNTHVSLLTN